MRRLFADRLRDARSADAQEGGATGSSAEFFVDAAANQPQTNFTSGELSPRLLGRPDIEQFGNGAQLLENFTVLPQGGITRRPGTYFVAETKDSTRRARLMRFVFSTVQATMLGLATSMCGCCATTRGWNRRPERRWNSPRHGPRHNCRRWARCKSADVLFLAHRSWQPRKISPHQRRHGASRPSMRWAGRGMKERGRQQDADAKRDHRQHHHHRQQRGLCRDRRWTAGAAAAGRGGWLSGSPTAFVVGDTTVAKVDGIVRSYRCIGAGTSAQILVNASEGDYITDGTCIWKFLGRSQVWSSVRITGYTDSTHVTATVIDRLPSTAVTGEWRLGAWSDTTGWPQCVTFHEERIVFARGQTIWMSAPATSRTSRPPMTTARSSRPTPSR